MPSTDSDILYTRLFGHGKHNLYQFIMKTFNFKQLDDNDEEIADILISMNMSRPAARTLALLQKVNEATSVDLERATGLRQPEVSIAMKELEPWIDEREEKAPGKGRPYKIYSLKVKFKEIINQLETEQKKAIEEEKVRFEQLKKLWKK